MPPKAIIQVCRVDERNEHRVDHHCGKCEYRAEEEEEVEEGTGESNPAHTESAVPGEFAD